MQKNWKHIKEAEAARQMEIEEGVKKLFTKWMIAICRTSTVAILGLIMWIGQWIASHSERVMNALTALFGGGK